MNCHETYLWMLEAEEPTAPPPDELADHLRACRKCRRRQRRLLGLLGAVRRLPLPAGDPAARERFEATFRKLPGPDVPRRPRRLPRWAGVTAAAAAVLIAAPVLWIFVSGGRQGAGNSARVAVPPERVWNEDELLPRLMKRNLRLAETTAPVERLDAVAGMAADLRRETLRQAGRRDVEGAARLASLHERVVLQGVVGRARALPPERRAEHVPPLVAQLGDAEREATQAAEKSPEAAAPLRRLARSAGDATLALRTPEREAPRPAPARPEPPGLLIETLVVQGLRLAEEDDPLRRADYCSDVADDLTRTIMEASGANDRERMVKLGTYLGVLKERAMAGNLERVALSESDPARREEFQRVRRRVDGTFAVLQQNLEKAPETTRPGLQDALDACLNATVDPDVLGLKRTRREPDGAQERAPPD